LKPVVFLLWVNVCDRSVHERKVGGCLVGFIGGRGTPITAIFSNDDHLRDGVDSRDKSWIRFYGTTVHFAGAKMNRNYQRGL
jgi:hypothetical protein